MSSDALLIAKEKLNEERRKLDVLQARYNELYSKLQILIQDGMTGITPTTSSPDPVASAPPPVPQKATSSADIELKTADSYLAIDIWVQAKIKEIPIVSSQIGTEANTELVGEGNLKVKADNYGPDDNLLPTLQLTGGTANYQKMVSSAGAGADLNFPFYTGYNDCLIHAILTSLSQSFRTLTKYAKDIIASYFRRAILVDIYNQLISKRKGQGITNDNNTDFIKNLNDLPTSNNLDTHIAGQLGIKYKIGILVRDRDKPETKWNLEGEYKGDTPYIMIYNPGQYHFEAVRFNPTTENPNSIYIFDKNNIKEWLQQKENLDHHETKLQCKIDGNDVLKGDKVSYKNNKYTVIDRKNNDNGNGCEYIYAVKGDNILLAEKNLRTFKENKAISVAGPLYYQTVQTNPQLEAQCRLTDQELSSLGIINLAPHVNECRIIK